MYKLEIILPTVLKRDTRQSSQLLQDQMYVPPVGAIYPVKAFLEDVDTQHVKVTLDATIKGFNTWYAFKEHILLDESQAEPNRKPEQVKIAVPGSDAPVIRLPRGTFVRLSDPIYEGCNFYWYEATHNGSRIPKTIAQADNIRAIARLANQVRSKLTEAAIKQKKIGVGQFVRMIVTSWFRPEPFNSRAGGAKHSQHLEGGAIDFRTKEFNKHEIWDLLDPWFPGGLGNYPNKNITHLDARGYKARFKKQ